MRNKRALILILLANIISGFAQGISMLAIPWYFSHDLGLESLFGIIYTIITFISVFWSLYSGTLIDRYPRKNIFMGINVAGALILGVAAFSGFYAGKMSMPLVAIVFMSTVFIYNIHYPSLYAFGQEIMERRHYGKISSMFEIQGQATSMLGGAVGAILLAGAENGYANLLGFKVHLPFAMNKWNLHEIFMMDAVTYLIAIILIAFIRYEPETINEVHTGSLKERIRMGLTYLRKYPLIFIFGWMSYNVFVVLLIEVQLLIAWYVHNHLRQQADVYASSEIYYTFGALFAGFAIQWVFAKTHTVMSIILMMLITVAILLICAFTCNLWVFFAFSVIIGITNAGIRVLRVTYLYDHVPNNMMGRTNSVFAMINIFSRGLLIALFSLPFFSKDSNVTWTYFICAIFVLISIVPLALNYKRLVAIDKK